MTLPAPRLSRTVLCALLALSVLHFPLFRPAISQEPPATVEPAQPKLRFNFRFQRWSDVLQWFAEQAGLSLVLDAPPPGTFNYTDTREYTPAEAIDLLNGVLSTKGYTLIRRDRMLLVVDVTEGVPQDLIPRIGLEELDRRGRFELVSVLFPLGNRNAEEVNQEIKPILGPHGNSYPLPKTKQLLVTDNAGVMQAIGAVIESIPQPAAPQPPKKPAEGEKPQLVVYPIRSADPPTALDVLKTLLPDAHFALDPSSDQISALATPTQQVAVKGVVEQMEANEPPEKRPRLQVYPAGEVEGSQLVTALQPLAPSARLSYDTRTASIAIWAPPEEQTRLKEALEYFKRVGPPGGARRLEIYPLEKAEPSAAMPLVQSLVPAAQLAIETRSKGLIAIASDRDHALIRALVKQLEEVDPAGNAQPSLVVYPISKPDISSVMTVLTPLVPEARLVSDTASSTIVAWARKADHEQIAQLIRQMESEADGRPESRLVVYPLIGAQTSTLAGLLATLIPKARLATDATSGHLVAWATDEEHQTITSTIEGLRKEELMVEVFRLDHVDPLSAQLAIGTLYSDAAAPGSTPPKIDADPQMQQLIVRASQQQLKEIRELLVKMGEFSLAPSHATQQKKFRIVPVQGHALSTLKQIQQLWPQLRANRLRVITNPAITRPGTRKAAEDSAPEGSGHGANGAVEEPGPSTAKEKEGEPAADENDAPQTNHLPQHSAPPIIAVPGERSITIASDDTEALDQLEALLRGLSRGTSPGGHDFVVFALENTSATAVAETLQQLLQGGPLGSRIGSGDIVIAADQRLNAVIVYAGRNERVTIEDLLRVLDSPDTPDSLTANKPLQIPVLHTSASRIERIVREIYAIQLTTGGGQPQIPVPGGASSQLAAVIQQVNAARSGPLLTVGVDEVSNSLVVMAPTPLASEISQLVGTLDQAAIAPNQRVEVVPFSNLKAERMQGVLDALLRSN